MGRFARIFKCICAIVALGILVTGLAAQAEKSSEVAISTANVAYTASIPESSETPHATIRSGALLVEVEASKEVTGGNSNELLVRRAVSSSRATVTARFLTMLTMVLAATSVSSSITRPVVHAEGRTRSAEETIISYIHSQGNFIG